MPLYNLREPLFQEFINKYTPFKAPSETAMRTVYLEKEAKIDEIKMREELKNQFIWVSIDETTDASGRFVAIVLAGALSDNYFGKPYFLVCEQLEQVNHTTICQVSKRGC